MKARPIARRALVAIYLLLLSGLAWGQEQVSRVRSQVAAVYREPSTGSEQVTQVLLGDSVQVRKVQGGWAEIVVPDQYRLPEGYPGWIRMEDLVRSATPATGQSVTVAFPEIHLRSEPSAQAEVVCDAGLASRLAVSQKTRAVEDGGDRWIPVDLPGRSEPVWVRGRQVMGEKTIPRGQGALLVDKARLFKGTRYLWGGMGLDGIDCSGLLYTVYRLYGITLPRDADQQFEVGKAVSKDELEPGDLVFFGATPTDITHVGMYAGKGNFVHASSRYGVAEMKLFQGWYLERYQGARRVLREEPPEKMVLVPNSAEGSR